MRQLIPALIMVAALVLASCGNTTRPGSESTESSSSTTSIPSSTMPPTEAETPQPLTGRKWKVTHNITIAGPQRVPVKTKASLSFEENGRVNVNTGCNTGSGVAAFDEGTLTISELVTTKMACVDEDLAGLEAAILRVLAEPMTWDLQDHQLTLTPKTISDTGLRLEEAASTR